MLLLLSGHVVELCLAVLDVFAAAVVVVVVIVVVCVWFVSI